MRTLSSATLAQFGKRMALAQLIELDLATPVRVTTARDSIDWGGNTFQGGKQTGIGTIKDQSGEVVGLSFQISGVPTEYLSLALGTTIQGKIVRVWTCFMDADTQAILDVDLCWAGTLDIMPIEQTTSTATITVTAEHRGITFARPKGYKYTDGDQQLLHPGDASLQFITAQASHNDVWPSAQFFRQ